MQLIPRHRWIRSRAGSHPRWGICQCGPRASESQCSSRRNVCRCGEHPQSRHRRETASCGCPPPQTWARQDPNLQHRGSQGQPCQVRHVSEPWVQNETVLAAQPDESGRHGACSRSLQLLLEPSPALTAPLTQNPNTALRHHRRSELRLAETIHPIYSTTESLSQPPVQAFYRVTKLLSSSGGTTQSPQTEIFIFGLNLSVPLVMNQA